MTFVINWRKVIGGFVNMIVFVGFMIFMVFYGPVYAQLGLGEMLLYGILIWIVIQILLFIFTWIFTRGLPDEEGGGRR